MTSCIVLNIISVFVLDTNTNAQAIQLDCLTDDYLKSSSKKWNNYIDSINKQLEQNNENIIN